MVHIKELDITSNAKYNRKCALSGIEIKFITSNSEYCSKEQTASLDRIDSTKGYTLDNVQWVHKAVNNMKMNLTDQNFINWCSIIHRYNLPKILESPPDV